jgi:hypothetical protein
MRCCCLHVIFAQMWTSTSLTSLQISRQVQQKTQEHILIVRYDHLFYLRYRRLPLYQSCMVECPVLISRPNAFPFQNIHSLPERSPIRNNARNTGHNAQCRKNPAKSPLIVLYTEKERRRLVPAPRMQKRPL